MRCKILHNLKNEIMFKNPAVFFEAGNFEGGKTHEGGIQSSNTSPRHFSFLVTTREKIVGKLSLLCERYLIAEAIFRAVD